MVRLNSGMSTRYLLPLALIFATVSAIPLVLAAPPDYGITAAPANLCVNPGIDGRSVITIQSQGSFAGPVSLSDWLDNPAGANGPTLTSIPSSVTLRPGQSVSFDLKMHTATSTETRLYYIYIYATTKSGGFHQTILQFNVNHDCSVGGATVPLNLAALTSPVVVLGASAATVVGLVFAMSYLVRRRGQSPLAGRPIP